VLYRVYRAVYVLTENLNPHIVAITLHDNRRNMKVKIGGLEIVIETPEELDDLVKRYGGNAAIESQEAATQASHSSAHHGKAVGHGAADSVLLKRFIDSGNNGLALKEVGEILGRRGKATRKAAKAWAKRIGLTNDDNLDVFDDCRIGTHRGARIKQSLLAVAQELHKGHK
jgi:hypothetical protein